MVWAAFLGLGFAFAALCVRYMMIEAGMVRDLLAHDPEFQPRYGGFTLDPAERTFNVREYRRRLPDGPLNAKRRQVEWALGLWFVLAVVVLAATQGRRG